MKTFNTFREDLASGRPAKKPVSSNLLKQRARDNEKAMKSGFMKMPDYVKKKFNEEEEYEPHYMYKGDKKVHAKKKEDHDKLKAQGYDHDDPKTKKVEESTRDKYNPKISDLRNKEKMKKVGLPAGKGPLVSEDENILEVSDHLKTRYIHKSMRDIDTKERASQLADKQGAPASVGKSLSKSTGKRRKGIARARKDLIKPATNRAGNSAVQEAKKPVVHSDKPDSLKMVKIKYNKPIKTKVTDIGPGGKEVVRKNFDEEKQKGIDGKVCWDGYKRMGTKKKGGKTVDNCVKAEDYVIDAIENYYLTELSPKTISSYQKKAGKEYSDLKKSTMSATSREGGYHKGYISQKEYDSQHDMAAKKRQRGKGLAMSKGKGVQKEGAMKRMATDKEESERLSASKGTFPGNDLATFKKKTKSVHNANKALTREEQIQLMTNLDLDESIGNLVRRGVGKVQDAIKQAEKKHGPVDPSKRNIPNPVSGDNIAKRLYGKSQKKR